MSYLNRISIFATCLICASFLSACGGEGTNAGVTTPSTSSAGTNLSDISSQLKSDDIASIQVGVNYNLRIYLPYGYNSNKQYPIIYALDGDYQFTNMVSILDQRKIPAILVAIGRGDRRTEDYNLPGAYAYYKFLTLDLIPYIEAKYKLQPGQRSLTGHSFGGLFVGIAFFQDRLGGQYFHNFIAQEGTFNIESYTSNTIAQLEQQVFEKSAGKMPVSLILSGATAYYYPTNLALFKQLQSRHYQEFNLQLKEYNQTHGGMFLDSFSDAMLILFP